MTPTPRKMSKAMDMQLDLETTKFGWDIAQTLIMAGISIYVWIVTGDKVNSKKIEDLEDSHNQELDGIKNRLTRMETTLSMMPDKQSIDNLSERLNEQSQLLYKISGELKGITDANAMMMQKLMNP